MDNITHSLIGLAIGKCALHPVPANKRDRIAPLVLLSSVIGNNLPDMDVIIAPLIRDGKIGQLLHHRGWTHTVLASPLLGILAVLLTILVYQRSTRKKLHLNFSEWLGVWAIGAFGVFGHVFADSWNDYGVHFWVPFQNHFRYGDSIFIVEPLLWISLLWTLKNLRGPRSEPNRASRSKIRNAVIHLGKQWLLLLSLGLLWFYPSVTRLPAAAATFFAFLMWLWDRQFKNPFLKAIPVIAVLATFHFGSLEAKSVILQNTVVPGNEVMDVLVSPSPSNPFCWRSILGMHTTGPFDQQKYSVHLGYVSLLPWLFDPANCHVRKVARHTAKLVTPQLLVSTPKISWSASKVQPFREYTVHLKENCALRSFFHFARFPYIAELGQDMIQFGDHRYDFSDTDGFAKFVTPKNVAECLKLSTPWTPPFLQYLKENGIEE